MFSPQGQPQRGLVEEFKHNFGIVTALCVYLAAPLMAVFTKLGTIGERFQGFPMFLGVLLQLLIVTLAAGPTGGVQVAATMWFMVFALLAHRLNRLRLERGGWRCHSMYTGRPWIPGNEVAVKGVAIPTIALFAGMFVSGFAPGVGAWLMIASFAQAVGTEVYRQQLNARARALSDARIEQDTVLQHHREHS